MPLEFGPGCCPEAQKPKTFRVETFYAQKLSGRSARNRFTTMPKNEYSMFLSYNIIDMLIKSGLFWNRPENGKWSGKILRDLKLSRKWEMIWKIRTVVKLSRNGKWFGKKLSGRAKTFRVALLPCYPGFSASGAKVGWRLAINATLSLELMAKMAPKSQNETVHILYRAENIFAGPVISFVVC